MKPRKIVRTAAFRHQDEPLGNLVRAQRSEAGFDCVQVAGFGFDKEQVFGAFRGLFFPSVDGVDGGHDVDAGNKPAVDESAGYGLCLCE